MKVNVAVSLLTHLVLVFASHDTPTIKTPASKQSDKFYTFYASATSRPKQEVSFKALRKSEEASKPKPQTYQAELPKRPDVIPDQNAPEHATAGLMTKHARGKPKRHIFCYYGSSANSRPSVGKFWPENIDPFLCTHVIFAFVDIQKDGSGLQPNNWNDLGENGLYKRTIDLKKKNPDLKVLLAVGGWKIGSKPFLPVIESESSWRTWISNVIIYLREYGFDGFDMDWEFPGWRGSGPEDAQKFTLLMKDLYEAFAEEAAATGREKLLLTMATASSAFYVEKSYEPYQIWKYMDYMLLMTYNYHGSGWEKETGHHSPLLPHRLDPEGEQRELYILWSVKYWLQFGIPKEKLIVGLPTYGLGWKLTSSDSGVRASADGGNTKGKYTGESGILSHYEICEHILQDDWTVQWIEDQKVPYAYGQGEWVGFDSPDSFYIKALTVLKEGLAGVFVWSVEMDDFNGHCGGPKYPLLRTVYEVFTQSSSMLAEIKQISPSHSASVSNSKKPGLHSQASAKQVVKHDDSKPLVSHNHDHVGQDHHSASISDHHSVSVSDHHSSSSDSHPHSASSASAAASSDESSHHNEGNDYNYYSYDDDTSLEYVDCHVLGLGIHADPKSCQHFVLCMPIDIDNLGPTRMICPAGTLYDVDLKVCNHEHLIHCEH